MLLELVNIFTSHWCKRVLRSLVCFSDCVAPERWFSVNLSDHGLLYTARLILAIVNSLLLMAFCVLNDVTRNIRLHSLTCVCKVVTCFDDFWCIACAMEFTGLEFSARGLASCICKGLVFWLFSTFYRKLNERIFLAKRTL